MKPFPRLGWKIWSPEAWPTQPGGWPPASTSWTGRAIRPTSQPWPTALRWPGARPGRPPSSCSPSTGRRGRGPCTGEGGLLLPNPSLCCESLAVRATALALLTYSARREFIIEPIARWLNSRRRSAAAWSSAWDSAVAAEALVQHSLATSSSPTSLAVRVSVAGPRAREAAFTLSSSEPGPHTLDLTNYHGELVVELQGEGVALLQVSSTYPLPSSRPPPPVAAWSLAATAEEAGGGAGLTVTACMRWLCPYETGYSGPAVLEVEVSSGYQATPGPLPGVASSSLQGGNLILQFLYLTPEELCLSLPLRREDMVANLSPSLSLTLSSHSSPEHTTTTTLPLPFLATDVCSLCASHSCPHCSPAPSSSSPTSSLLSSLLLLLTMSL